MEEAAPPAVAVPAVQGLPESNGSGMHVENGVANGDEPMADASVEASAEGEPTKAANTANPPASNPLKKRKVALFLAYVGHGYNGMQRNPGVKTIEEDLFKAIHAAGGVSDSNADERGFMKIHWMRAARTDKGVSAVGQVVSLKMVAEPPGIIERINANLPPQIRVFGYSRVTNGFDARKHCDKRRYEYILPAWAFDPAIGQPRSRQPGVGQPQQAERQEAEQQGQVQQAQQAEQEEVQQAEQEEVQQAEQQQAEEGGAAQQEGQASEAPVGEGAEGQGPAGGGGQQSEEGPVEAADEAGGPPAQQQGEGLPVDGASQREQQGSGGPAAAAMAASAGGDSGSAGAGAEAGLPQKFVFDQACVDKLSSILKQYEGTHNFHNFTVKVAASAPQAKRYILSFRCQGLLDINGQPWVKMVVIGQSFMLHQIRKMVGMAVAVMRGTAPEGCLKLALKTHKDLNVPMAPELGLFLDECYYESYSRQWGHQHGGDLELAPYAADVEAFKAAWLYPHIAGRDAEEGVNMAWLRTLNDANFDFSRWEDAVAGRVQAGLRGVGKPLPKGAGAASYIGGFEGYGQHKRPRSGNGGGGRGGRGGGRGGRGGGEAKRPRSEGGSAAGGASHTHASMNAEYSD